jgi:uncharacterized protein involved in oxidation of intracellular sulfur
MAEVLMILNDGPAETERSYNGLRLALGLTSTDGTHVRIFLIGDAVTCARRDLEAAGGPYPVGRTLGILVRRGAEIVVCGTCLDARRLTDADLAEGVRRSSVSELAEWTLSADRVAVF